MSTIQLPALKIINSQTGAAILNLFFANPDREYYLRQIEKLTGYSVGNIRREMTKLQADGLFVIRQLGKMKLYRLNPAYPLYSEVRDIIRKTIGIEGTLKGLLSGQAGINFAFIYGSFAEGKEKALSDIDIIVIGVAKPKEIKSLFFEHQNKIGREINSIVYTQEEFLNKLKNKDHFISALARQKKIFIKGEEGEFKRFIQIRKTRKT